MKDVVYVRQKMHNSNQQIQMQGTGLGLTSEDWHMCVHLCFKLYRVFMVCMNLFFFFIISHCIQLAGKPTVSPDGVGRDSLFLDTFWLLFFCSPPFEPPFSIMLSGSMVAVYLCCLLKTLYILS